VWLDIVGDVTSPAQYWDIGNFLPKKHGADVQVRGIAVPLVHDTLLYQFVNDVGAIRFRMPNGQDCGSDCLFYEVTATPRGRFFSGVEGGFGMEHCCHLLVVEQVRHPPQSGWLGEWGRLKGGCPVGLGVALKRAFVDEFRSCRYYHPRPLVRGCICELAPTRNPPWTLRIHGPRSARP